MDTPSNEQSGAFRRLLWLTAEPRQNICAASWGISPYPLSLALRDLAILTLVHTLFINLLVLSSALYLYHPPAPRLNLKVQTFLFPKLWWEETWRRNRTREKSIYRMPSTLYPTLSARSRCEQKSIDWLSYVRNQSGLGLAIKRGLTIKNSALQPCCKQVYRIISVNNVIIVIIIDVIIIFTRRCFKTRI